MPTYTMRVFRGDPRGGEFKDYRVETGEGMVVLDVLHRIQATQAPDLACRWNCKAGKCGSCSAEVNGKPRLMCMTRMNLFADGETISVAPLRTFPIIRDLVTDVSYNYEKAKQVPPLRLKPPDGDGKYRMMQEDVEDDHPFPGLDAIVLELTASRVAPEHPHGVGRHHVLSWNRPFSSSGIFGTGSRLSEIPPSRWRSTTLRVPHVSSLYGWSSRVCPPRLSLRSSAAVAQHSATVSNDLRSSTVCHPGL